MDAVRSNGIVSNGKTSPSQQQPQNQTVPPLQRFLSHVSQLSKVIAPSQDDDDVVDGFSVEFDALKAQSDAWKESFVIPAKAGALPFNIKRNRYRDIVPFDHARVVLAPNGTSADDVDGADYINASFLKLPHDAATILAGTDAASSSSSEHNTDTIALNGKLRLERFHRILADSNSRYDRYIAAQGPLAKTVDDFWLMIWQQNIKVIIMACRTVEYARQKCEQYWPPDSTTTEETVKNFGKIRVRLNSKDTRKPSNDYIVRTLLIEHVDAPTGQPPRVIKQFHYTNWYDHDIPDDASAQTEIINFLRLVREEQPPSPSSSSSSISSSSSTTGSSSLSNTPSSSSSSSPPPPILVHCSAGCGRTGTLIAIDYVWSLLKRGGIGDDLDLFKIVRFMRFQRSAMVQTKEQYRLVYSTLAKIFHGYLDSLKLNLLVDLESNGAITDASQDAEAHDYENWKPSAGKQQQQQQQQQSTSVNSYENIIPALLMNQEAVEAAAAAAAAENQKQRKMYNGRYDDNAWRKKQMLLHQQQLLPQQHPLIRSNATRHHTQPQQQHQQPQQQQIVTSSSSPYANHEMIQQHQQVQNCDTSAGVLGGNTVTNGSSVVLPNIPSSPSLESGGGGGSNSGRNSLHGSRSSLVSPGGGSGGGAPTTSTTTSASPVESFYVNHEVFANSTAAAAVSPSSSSSLNSSMSSSMSRSIALTNLLSAEALDSNLLGLRRSPPLNFLSLESDDAEAAATDVAGSATLVAASPLIAASCKAVSSTSTHIVESPAFTMVGGSPLSKHKSNNNNNISPSSSSTSNLVGKSMSSPSNPVAPTAVIIPKKSTTSSAIPSSAASSAVSLAASSEISRQEEEDRKKLSQSSAEVLSGLDELDALINAEMESVRHMQLTLAKDPATEALHKRIEDSRQIVGHFQQPHPGSSSSTSSTGGGIYRQRSSSLSRSRSGGGGVFGGGSAATAHSTSSSGVFMDGPSVVNLRGTVPPVGVGGVSGGGGVVLTTASKTLPTSDRSQRLTTLKKRYSGGDATDLAVGGNAAFPSFGAADGVDTLETGLPLTGAGVGSRLSGNPNPDFTTTSTMMMTSASALPPGWQTMTNWRHQFPLSASSSASSSSTSQNTKAAPIYSNLTVKTTMTQGAPLYPNLSSVMTTPPPPLPAKQTNPSAFLPNLVGGVGIGRGGVDHGDDSIGSASAGAGPRLKSKYV